jgi:hypothetical protein
LVIALESAFQFDTREVFFREAFRILRPGGRLVTTDIIPRADASRTLKARVRDRLVGRFWHYLPANAYDRDEYAHKLAATGFNPVRVDSIHEKVWPPFLDFARRRLSDPEIKARMSPIVRFIWRLTINEIGPVAPDYIFHSPRSPSTQSLSAMRAHRFDRDYFWFAPGGCALPCQLPPRSAHSPSRKPAMPWWLPKPRTRSSVQALSCPAS